MTSPYYDPKNDRTFYDQCYEQLDVLGRGSYATVCSALFAESDASRLHQNHRRNPGVGWPVKHWPYEAQSRTPLRLTQLTVAVF